MLYRVAHSRNFFFLRSSRWQVFVQGGKGTPLILVCMRRDKTKHASIQHLKLEIQTRAQYSMRNKESSGQILLGEISVIKAELQLSPPHTDKGCRARETSRVSISSQAFCFPTPSQTSLSFLQPHFTVDNSPASLPPQPRTH